MERTLPVGVLGLEGSLRGRWTAMALRRQLSHCCLWKTSLTCRVCDCAWLGSWERTRKMFLAAEKAESVVSNGVKVLLRLLAHTFWDEPYLCLHC